MTNHVTVGEKAKSLSRCRARGAAVSSGQHLCVRPTKSQGDVETTYVSAMILRRPRYTCTVGSFRDGRVAEIFLGNHKTNSSADTNARDSAIVASLALQYGADIETIRKALCRDSHGRASGPLGAALDRLADGNAQ